MLNGGLTSALVALGALILEIAFLCYLAFKAPSWPKDKARALGWVSIAMFVLLLASLSWRST